MDRRRDEEWLAAAWRDGRSLVLILDGEGRATVDVSGLALVPVTEVDPEAEHWLLGVEEDIAIWGCVGEPPRRLGARPRGLREVGAHLDDRDAGLLVAAVALANWHATHRRCPRCGEPTTVTTGGWTRRCPADASEHFPRTDPAVIVLVSDGAGGAVLGRQPSWPEGRYSVLAGFVEPGESAEQAVVREVAEECGVVVRDVAYSASQPWPFPASLMLGFMAYADTGSPLTRTDGELADAQWFSREDIRAGAVLLPPPVSIAHRLINDWLEGTIR